ncbi:MAG: DNA translocase FtsK 4TM domain-containing protein [Phycisphaerae bacterium]|nr:DNA translocase FtsK 4TM domain-containing protein [Phycisphaerae bacterium]MDD5380448.1 DNA translocase FtsK 4TM domain-containing protein [Phycisphaerae bacterium]
MKEKKNSYGSTRLTTGEAALECLGIAVALVLLCSCISFNIGDWPSRYVWPTNTPPANWCGMIGAFCAYYLLYYVGPGVFVILISAICLLGARLARRTVDQGILRTIGLLLVTAAASSSFYLLLPHGVFSFPMGSGGVLGVGAAEFLRSHFALLGTFILITATWVVGVVLLADTFLTAIFGGVGFVFGRMIGVASPMLSMARHQSQALGEIWQKLSERQRQLSEEAEEETSFESYIEEEEAEETTAAVETREPKQLRLSLPVTHKPAKAYVPTSYDDYRLPPMELLCEPERTFASIQEKVIKAKASALEKLLTEFNVNAHVVAADTGPVITMFELELAAGVKVSQISNLSNDMARALGVGAVRVVAPLPGKHTIGIEVPNNEKEKVRIKDLMQSAGDRPRDMEIPLFLGKDSSGEALVSDLTSMPHLLIAGTTGSGKSVCINSIIAGILLTKRPDEVKMILIDPKMVEMTAFNTIPHLMSPIVIETQRAVQILEWATVKMDERYALFAEARVKNIAEYNRLGAEEINKRFMPDSTEEEEKIAKKLPYIVIIIDELADLMMTAAKEIEAYIVRLAQKSRAVGIHIVLATQRPQATVVTGLIKSNMPTRIGFRVAARLDSRIVLDQNGAEALLGQGDMLFLKPGSSELVRAQGTFMDDAEIQRIVKYLKEVAEPQFHPELTELGRIDTSEMARDELFDEAVRIILESHRGSVSLLQRKLSIGYARASRIIEMMASAGILGEYKGSQAREVLMTLKDYERLREKMEAEAEEAEDSDDEDEDSSGPNYVSEGQRGYVAIDNDAE